MVLRQARYTFDPGKLFSTYKEVILLLHMFSSTFQGEICRSKGNYPDPYELHFDTKNMKKGKGQKLDQHKEKQVLDWARLYFTNRSSFHLISISQFCVHFKFILERLGNIPTQTGK